MESQQLVGAVNFFERNSALLKRHNGREFAAVRLWGRLRRRFCSSDCCSDRWLLGLDWRRDISWGIWGNIAVYAISNAPSIPSSTTIEFTATFAEDSNAVANWLFEIGSLTGTLDTYETGTGEYIGSESTVPSTPNLDTSATDFIFVVSWSTESCPAGSGYTLFSGLTLNAQYILSQPSGSIPTSFGNPSHGIDYFDWNCVACAFNVLPPSLNFVQNGPPLQIPYELVAYQGATLTGSYAYSCGPPIIRGLYQTPISTHT